MPPVFTESSCENIVEISSTISWCEHCITSANYQCHLETIEACPSRMQELEQLSCQLLSPFWDA
jgi:hypothetical protein